MIAAPSIGIWVAFALVMLSVLAYGISCYMRERHIHQWSIIGAQEMRLQSTYMDVSVGDSQPVTEILEKCIDCETVRTSTLHGSWTLDQLQTKP